MQSSRENAFSSTVAAGQTTSSGAQSRSKAYQLLCHEKSGRRYADLDWHAFSDHQDRQCCVSRLAHNSKIGAIICSNAPFGARLPFGVLPSEDDLDRSLVSDDDRGSRSSTKDKHSAVKEHFFRQPDLLDVCDFMQVSEQREYLIENLIVEGQPGLWAGDEKTWKTTLGLWAGASISLGIDFLGFKTKQRRVAWQQHRPGKVLFQADWTRTNISTLPTTPCS